MTLPKKYTAVCIADYAPAMRTRMKKSAYASACLAAGAYAHGFRRDAVRRERAWQLQCLAATLEGKEQPICTM